MADAILHAEYAPWSGRGARCDSGEFIVGPGYNGSPYPNRFTVFDPVTKTAKTYAVTVPFHWVETSYGVPYQGGVAVAAASTSGSSVTYLFVLYPDGTFDVHASPLTIAAGVGLAVVPSGDLWMIQTSGTATASVWDGTSWSSTGIGLQATRSTLNVVGSTIWYWSSTGVIGVSTVTGAVVTTHTVGGSSSNVQTEIYDGRIWNQTAAANLRGVRLSDGNIVNITTPAATGGRLAIGDNKFWVASSTSGFEVDPVTSNTVAHPHPLPYAIGSISQMFYGAGRAWAMGIMPTV